MSQVPTPPVIAVRGLRKSYGAREVLTGVGLAVHRGEIYVLLGSNGAGKTTLVEILLGLRSPDGGEVSVFGCDPGRAGVEWKARIGGVLQSSGVDGDLRVGEALEVMAGYYAAASDPGQLLKGLGLGRLASAPVRTLSRGEARRLELGIALVGRPSLLILDEPTSGLDPVGRRVAWRLIADAQGQGATVLLATQSLEEAQALAHRLGVLRGGHLVAEGTPDEITAPHGTEVRFSLPLVLPIEEAPVDIRSSLSSANGQYRVRTSDPTRTVGVLTAWALAKGVSLGEFEVRPATLEDVYLRLMDDECEAL